MIKFIKKMFGITPKNTWVKKNVFSYGLSCRNVRGGSFYIQRNQIDCFYNGAGMESKLEQLKIRAKEMSFENGFWFLRSKANEYGYNFYYEKLIK